MTVDNDQIRQEDDQGYVKDRSECKNDNVWADDDKIKVNKTNIDHTSSCLTFGRDQNRINRQDKSKAVFAQ